MCRLAVYAVFILFCSSFFGFLTFVRAGEVNITVDDTNPSILYQPDAAWFFNGNSSRCTFCLTPPSPTIADNSTWHHGLHVIPIQDADDLAQSSVDVDAPAMRLRRSEGELVVGRRNTYDGTNDPTNGATTSPFVANKLDVDDAGFVDSPVSVQFNFTGSAIYLFCILPLGVPPNTNSTPTLMNLTFTLDGEPAGSFFHNGSINTGGFQLNVPVLSRGNLSESTHNLLVNLGPNSVFLLDYYVYSQSDGSNIGSPSAPATGIVSESTAIPKKRDVRTFAGAVGGSVGVLAVVSACVAISICRRRRRSTRQHLRDRELQSDAQSFHTDVSDDPPSMQGPAPFIPRYFPGTLPPAPPPYISPASMDGPTPSSYHVPPPIPYPHRAPPAAALDAAHDTEPLDIPPPFSVAVSSPAPPVLVDAMRHTIPRIPRIPPPRLEEDGQPALPEVAPTEATVLPPRSLQRSQTTHLPVSLPETPTISSTHSEPGSEAEAPLSRAVTTA